MKYISEFRDRDLVQKMIRYLNNISTKPARYMEVCGGHTMSIMKYGIPSLLPEQIELISGPGCPVCVTGRQYIDHAVALARLENTIIATYGDLIRVPGSTSSLNEEKADGADIRMVYSTLEALEMAKTNPGKKIIFLGIGFETTIPSTAVAILEAEKNNIDNFYVLSSHKLMPPAMNALIDEGIKINGYIAPGHVTTITGTEMYEPISRNYKIPVVVSGFEPLDILQAIAMLTHQHENGFGKVEIQYKRAVSKEGNPKALKIMNSVFEPRDDWWRGLGILEKSGMALRKEYASFDAEKTFNVNIEETIEPKGCICGQILKGLKKPDQCALFAKECNPTFPVGACMVSNEGSCHAYYKYKEHA